MTLSFPKIDKFLNFESNGILPKKVSMEPTDSFSPSVGGGSSMVLNLGEGIVSLKCDKCPKKL